MGVEFQARQLCLLGLAFGVHSGAIMRGVEVVLFVVGFLVWLSAVVHAFGSLRHLSGKSTLTQMLFSGLRGLDAENFTPRGRTLRRRSWWSLLAFVILCVLGVLLTAR